MFFRRCDIILYDNVDTATKFNEYFVESIMDIIGSIDATVPWHNLNNNLYLPFHNFNLLTLHDLYKILNSLDNKYSAFNILNSKGSVCNNWANYFKLN